VDEAAEDVDMVNAADLVGAEWEQRVASSGAERAWTVLDCSQLLSLTCGVSCLCWSRACVDGR
jgi:hypothetical protein